jgi:hypothetical protein
VLFDDLIADEIAEALTLLTRAEFAELISLVLERSNARRAARLGRA